MTHYLTAAAIVVLTAATTFYGISVAAKLRSSSRWCFFAVFTLMTLLVIISYLAKRFDDGFLEVVGSSVIPIAMGLLILVGTYRMSRSAQALERRISGER